MKILIASDIHGSAAHTETLIGHIERERPDRVALLGDVLYHGPRNDLPDGYAPKRVAALLNALAESVIAVRGNCDAEVDQMVLDFPCMADYAYIADGDRTLFLTHGHLFSLACPHGHAERTGSRAENERAPRAGRMAAPPQAPTLPPLPALPEGAIVLSGHTHVKALEKRDGLAFANPGSVSLPKDGSRSFAVYEDGTVSLRALDDGAVLSSLAL